MCHIFFIHSFVDGHLGCFHVLVVVNRAAMNIVVHDTFWIMAFSGYMPSTGIAGSYGSSIFRFLRKLHTWTWLLSLRILYLRLFIQAVNYFLLLPIISLYEYSSSSLSITSWRIFGLFPFFADYLKSIKSIYLSFIYLSIYLSSIYVSSIYLYLWEVKLYFSWVNTYELD